MESRKLTNMVSLISENLSQAQIPFCLIGAMALGAYGLPRYTSDIDLLIESIHWPKVVSLMERLGYECYHLSPESFDVLDADRIRLFADRFGLRELIEKYLDVRKTATEGPNHL